MFKAIITGISGQDGFYLARYLSSLGYQVTGIRRRTANPQNERINILQRDPRITIVEGDVTDESSIASVISDVKPDEFYNLAAQSFVGGSWAYPTSTFNITGGGVLNCLEALRRTRKQCRFYQASSSEMFGNASDGSIMLDESSPFMPESPYAAAKVFGHHISQVYRKSYNMFVSCGILFNHESPLRGQEFVSRKITRGLAMIKHGLASHLSLGNMSAKRDWGHAKDYVRAMHSMLQISSPMDFVVATGETHSVQEFFDKSCQLFDINPSEVLKIDSHLLRPNDVKVLIGNSRLALKKLNWSPNYTFDQLVQDMCHYDSLSLSGIPGEVTLAEKFI